MAEGERVHHDKTGDVEQKHNTKKQDSKPLFERVHTWDEGPLSLTETPFQPRMDDHAAFLSAAGNGAPLTNFVLHLQQTYGNRYVQRLVESVRAQAKLTVSNPNDIYEQEADRVAETVTRSMKSPVQRQDIPEEEPVQTKASPQLQRQPEEEEELPVQTVTLQRQEEEELQMEAVESQPASVSDRLESEINTARGNGEPLPDAVKEPMGQAFGADFSGVRTHTDARADALNQQLSSKAFTKGRDIFFRGGEYSPATNDGSKLVAHELTHVIQQASHSDDELLQRHTCSECGSQVPWVCPNCRGPGVIEKFFGRRGPPHHRGPPYPPVPPHHPSIKGP
jgi:hypothetical protein